MLCAPSAARGLHRHRALGEASESGTACRSDHELRPERCRAPVDHVHEAARGAGHLRQLRRRLRVQLMMASGLQSDRPSSGAPAPRVAAEAPYCSVLPVPFRVLPRARRHALPLLRRRWRPDRWPVRPGAEIRGREGLGLGQLLRGHDQQRLHRRGHHGRQPRWLQRGAHPVRRWFRLPPWRHHDERGLQHQRGNRLPGRHAELRHQPGRVWRADDHHAGLRQRRRRGEAGAATVFAEEVDRRLPAGVTRSSPAT
jgi:hypothetical protein